MLPATARMLLNWEIWQNCSASLQMTALSRALHALIPNLQAGYTCAHSGVHICNRHQVPNKPNLPPSFGSQTQW